MRIVAVSGTHEWEVRAEWFGADRAVHRGDLFACIRYAANNKEG